MRILLCNDDGIFAPGLMAMYNALSRSHEVVVVAPHTVQSGGSHAVTIRHPVLWHEVTVDGRFRGTSVEGTPADCIKLALNELLGERPDLVVSGINSGLNTGVHVIYSGTVAAAIEAAILGCTAVAVSLALYRDMDYVRAADISSSLIERILASKAPPGRVFNVNIPEIGPDTPRGVRVRRHSTQAMPERIERRSDPYGRSYYWLSGNFKDVSGETETDRAAIDEGYVCVTPLQFDLTDGRLLAELDGWEWPRV